jgi:putative transposase
MQKGYFYHIYNRGINRALIFFEERNYYFFLKRFEYYLLKYVDIYSYCLLPNHFHYLIKIKENEFKEDTNKDMKRLTALEKAFRDFFISYAKSINSEYKRTGALFQYKFKRKLITDHNYLTSIIAYIHLNPVKAGLCNEPQDWKFSSYKSVISKSKTNIKRKEVIEFYGDIGNLILFHKDYKDFQKEKNYLFNLKLR